MLSGVRMGLAGAGRLWVAQIFAAGAGRGGRQRDFWGINEVSATDGAERNGWGGVWSGSLSGQKRPERGRRVVGYGKRADRARQ